MGVLVSFVFPGSYAKMRASQCHSCGRGSISTEDRTMCQPCPSGTYSHAGHDSCRVCRFPRLLHEDECIWCHSPLVAVRVASLLVAASFVFAAVRRAKHQRLRKKAMKIAEAMDMLYHDLWEESPETVGSYSVLLQELGADTWAFQNMWLTCAQNKAREPG